MRATGNYSPGKGSVPEASDHTFGIVVAEWNDEVTEALFQGAIDRLQEAGAQNEHLLIRRVPGSFEVPHAVHRLLEEEAPDVVIALGSLIRGETIHFDVIAHSVAHALQELNIRSSSPVLFGILTDENMDQARARAGGSKGNKGAEAAEAALKMLKSL